MRGRILLAQVTLILAAGSARASGLPWEVWETPSRLAEIDPRDQVLETSSHCLDGCRYDRSNPGSESDNLYPERWLYRDADEAVVFDEPGPGALTRIWVTSGFGGSTCIDPATRVRLYVDGAAMPTLDVALAALFDGSTAPFTPPLVADRLRSSGGQVSRVPIAYAQSLRIALSKAQNGGINPCQPAGADPAQRLLWFQMQHHRLAPGTPVTSFMAGADAPAWRAFLSHAGDDPWNGLPAPEIVHSTLAPGAVLTLATRGGPGWLRGIRLRVPRSAYAEIDLRLRFDGIASVDVPLSDFFATATHAQVPARGVLLGEDAAGWLYAWLPMPFRAEASVELAAQATLPGAVAVDSALSFEDAPVAMQAAPFSATLREECVAGGTFTLYEQRGAGRLVGISARYRALDGAGRDYLEGDERAYFDDATAPAWHGTGVEDFYDGGFYFDHGAFASPLSGATEVDADGTGTTAVYRLMPGDALAFSSALRVSQEAGPSAADPRAMCVRAVAYAYTRAEAAIVHYDGFEIGDRAGAMAHAYGAPADAQCGMLASRFEDDAGTQRIALACGRASGPSHFRFRVDAALAPLRLRRTFDAGLGSPGSMAGTAGAIVRVNGVVAGAFAPVIANPARRWQQQEIVLADAVVADVLDIEIDPVFSAGAPLFGESRWDLRGGWKDTLFADGFDVAAGALR